MDGILENFGLQDRKQSGNALQLCEVEAIIICHETEQSLVKILPVKCGRCCASQGDREVVFRHERNTAGSKTTWGSCEVDMTEDKQNIRERPQAAQKRAEHYNQMADQNPSHINTLERHEYKYSLKITDALKKVPLKLQTAH